MRPHAHSISRLIGAVAAAAALLLPATTADAQTGVLFVEGNRVGVGTETPGSTLHVQSTQGDAQLSVEEISSTAAARTLFSLHNNGGIRFGMFNDGAGTVWQFSALSNFNIDFNGHAGNELQVEQDGDLEIGGVLMQASSRELKTGFEALDPSETLARVVELPIQSWIYREDDDRSRHIGPVAEDFHRVFGIGSDKTLSPSDQVGVALLAIQGLQREVEERDRQIAELSQRLERLEAALAGRE